MRLQLDVHNMNGIILELYSYLISHNSKHVPELGVMVLQMVSNRSNTTHPQPSKERLTPRSIFSVSVRFKSCACLLRFLFSHVMATAYSTLASTLRQMNETQMA